MQAILMLSALESQVALLALLWMANKKPRKTTIVSPSYSSHRNSYPFQNRTRAAVDMDTERIELIVLSVFSSFSEISIET